MSEEKKSYGKATIGVGTPDEKKVNIKDFVRCRFVDNWVVSICTLETDTLIVSIENLQSSGGIPISRCT